MYNRPFPGTSYWWELRASGYPFLSLFMGIPRVIWSLYWEWYLLPMFLRHSLDKLLYNVEVCWRTVNSLRSVKVPYKCSILSDSMFFLLSLEKVMVDRSYVSYPISTYIALPAKKFFRVPVFIDIILDKLISNLLNTLHLSLSLWKSYAVI